MGIAGTNAWSATSSSPLLTSRTALAPSAGRRQPSRSCCLDHTHCPHAVVESLAYCPLCGEPICPECGSHDVSQISRVTGYMAAVSGWNRGKAQELKDRARYTPSDLAEIMPPAPAPVKVPPPPTHVPLIPAEVAD